MVLNTQLSLLEVLYLINLRILSISPQDNFLLEFMLITKQTRCPCFSSYFQLMFCDWISLFVLKIHYLL